MHETRLFDMTTMTHDEERRMLAATILGGFCANPSVFAARPDCGWGLVNCTDEYLAEYALKLADDLREAEVKCRRRLAPDVASANALESLKRGAKNAK